MKFERAGLLSLIVDEINGFAVGLTHAELPQSQLVVFLHLK